MYDELIEELRQHHCDAKEDDTQEVCEECAYDVIIADKSAPSGIASVCVCGLMNKAADAIEDLDNRLNLHRQGKIRHWIPVTERLPLLNTPVLATDGIEVDISWMYGVPPRWITSYTAIDEDKLTHWMPLPQTPKDWES